MVPVSFRTYYWRQALICSHRSNPFPPVLRPPQVRSGERRRASEAEERVLQMEAEQEAVLTSMGEELDAACRSLAQNGEDKLQVLLFRSSITCAVRVGYKPLTF